MIALVILALLAFLFTIAAWIADRTQPEHDEPFIQPNHCTVVELDERRRAAE